MNPPIHYPVIAADALFVLLALALGFELLNGRRRLRWDPCWAILAIYVASLALSLIATSSLPQSLFKLATEGFLAGLTVVTVLVVDNVTLFRRAIITWLSATVIMCIVGLVGLTAFVVDPQGPIYQYTGFHFGTLPPGHYPRLQMTFLNANMACNYLTVSIGLLFAAWSEGWLQKRQAIALLAAFVIAAALTISPGLGGIGVALGTAGFILRGSRPALLLGIAAALAFLVAVWFTPIAHSTATFQVHVPGTQVILEPSGRFLTGAAAWRELMTHPLAGHGIGIDAVFVRYADPSGYLQQLTDAHNTFLNIAAQAGVAGLVGLLVLIGYAAYLTVLEPKDTVALLLGLTFLNGFVYQGLSGSFEDARHLWVLLGLLIARVRISRADGRSHRVGAPLPG
jgi:O-antigen ligase